MEDRGFENKVSVRYKLQVGIMHKLTNSNAVQVCIKCIYICFDRSGAEVMQQAMQYVLDLNILLRMLLHTVYTIIVTLRECASAPVDTVRTLTYAARHQL